MKVDLICSTEEWVEKHEVGLSEAMDGLTRAHDHRPPYISRREKIVSFDDSGGKGRRADQMNFRQGIITNIAVSVIVIPKMSRYKICEY